MRVGSNYIRDNNFPKPELISSSNHCHTNHCRAPIQITAAGANSEQRVGMGMGGSDMYGRLAVICMGVTAVAGQGLLETPKPVCPLADG